MDNKYVNEYVMKLQVYNIKIKAVHFSTKSYAEHKTSDQAYSTVCDYLDKIGELSYGALAQPAFDDFTFNVSIKGIKTLTEILKELHTITADYKKEIDDDVKMSGVKGVLEALMGELDQLIYLTNFK